MLLGSDLANVIIQDLFWSLRILRTLYILHPTLAEVSFFKNYRSSNFLGFRQLSINSRVDETNFFWLSAWIEHCQLEAVIKAMANFTHWYTTQRSRRHNIVIVILGTITLVLNTAYVSES